MTQVLCLSLSLSLPPPPQDSSWKLKCRLTPAQACVPTADKGAHPGHSAQRSLLPEPAGPAPHPQVTYPISIAHVFVARLSTDLPAFTPKCPRHRNHGELLKTVVKSCPSHSQSPGVSTSLGKCQVFPVVLKAIQKASPPPRSLTQTPSRHSLFAVP